MWGMHNRVSSHRHSSFLARSWSSDLLFICRLCFRPLRLEFSPLPLSFCANVHYFMLISVSEHEALGSSLLPPSSFEPVHSLSHHFPTTAALVSAIPYLAFRSWSPCHSSIQSCSGCRRAQSSPWPPRAGRQRPRPVWAGALSGPSSWEEGCWPAGDPSSDHGNRKLSIKFIVIWESGCKHTRVPRDKLAWQSVVGGMFMYLDFLRDIDVVNQILVVDDDNGVGVLWRRNEGKELVRQEMLVDSDILLSGIWMFNCLTEAMFDLWL